MTITSLKTEAALILWGIRFSNDRRFPSVHRSLSQVNYDSLTKFKFYEITKNP